MLCNGQRDAPLGLIGAIPKVLDLPDDWVERLYRAAAVDRGLAWPKSRWIRYSIISITLSAVGGSSSCQLFGMAGAESSYQPQVYLNRNWRSNCGALATH
jgi:hypothetical protein